MGIEDRSTEFSDLEGETIEAVRDVRFDEILLVCESGSWAIVSAGLDHEDPFLTLDGGPPKLLKVPWDKPDGPFKRLPLLCFLIETGCVSEEEAEMFRLESETKRASERKEAKEARFRRYVQLKTEFEPEGECSP